MRRIIFFMMLIMLSNSINADIIKLESQVKLIIVNVPPEITALNFQPDTIFEDSTIKCNAIVNDQDRVTLQFEWYINDNLISSDSEIKNIFKAGDKITCKVTPDDSYDKGNPKNISAIVNAAPLSLTASKFMINIAGKDTSLADLNSIKSEKGMLGVTGFTVKEFSSTTRVQNGFLGIIVFLLAILNINLISRYYLKQLKEV